MQKAGRDQAFILLMQDDLVYLESILIKKVMIFQSPIGNNNVSDNQYNINNANWSHQAKDIILGIGVRNANLIGFY